MEQPEEEKLGIDWGEADADGTVWMLLGSVKEKIVRKSVGRFYPMVSSSQGVMRTLKSAERCCETCSYQTLSSDVDH